MSDRINYSLDPGEGDALNQAIEDIVIYNPNLTFI